MSNEPIQNKSQSIPDRNSSVESQESKLSDEAIIHLFVKGEKKFIYGENLHLEPQNNFVALKDKNNKILGLIKPYGKYYNASIQSNCTYVELLQKNLSECGFVCIGDAKGQKGFTEYKQYNVPDGYEIHYTSAKDLWKIWWPSQRINQGTKLQLDILVLVRDQWFPIQNMAIESPIIYIKILVQEIKLNFNDKLVWINKRNAKKLSNLYSKATLAERQSLIQATLYPEIEQEKGEHLELEDDVLAQTKEQLSKRVSQCQAQLNRLNITYKSQMLELQDQYLQEVKAIQKQLSHIEISLRNLPD